MIIGEFFIANNNEARLIFINVKFEGEKLKTK